MDKKEKKETIVLNREPKKIRPVKESYAPAFSKKVEEKSSNKPVTSSMTFTINIY